MRLTLEFYMVNTGLALCKQTGVELGSALCRIDIGENKEPPEWIELFGADVNVLARDGRHWKKSDPQAIVRAFTADRKDLAVDLEHATEIKGPKGEPAPAVGWMTEVRVTDDGRVEARVEWNEDGIDMLSKRKYRYVSPAFRYDIETREILQLTSAGLTNNPALHLAELARHQEGEEMDKELLKLLGLAETATAEDVRKAVQAKMDAGAKAQDELTKVSGDLATARQHTASALKDMVPRTDLTQALARAETAEATVKAADKRDFDGRVQTAIAQALKEAKITPAQEGFYRGVCRDEDGLKSFQAFASQTAPLVKDGTVVKEGTPAPGTLAAGAEPTADEIAIAARCGISPEDFKKQKQAVMAELGA